MNAVSTIVMVLILAYTFSNISDNSTVTDAPDVNPLETREYAECSTWSRDHFRSFDERDFSFNGDCTYTMAAATDGTFDVTIKNIDCYTLNTCYKVNNHF